MQFADFENILRSRRSIRNWEDREVPEELLKKAIELTTLAPNAGNLQNWHFYAVLNRDIIRAIADATEENAHLIAAWAKAEGYGDEVSWWWGTAETVRKAPAAVAIAAAKYNAPIEQVLAKNENTDPRAGRIRTWRNIANSRVQTVASATTYLLLILHQMGLGAVWMTGPLQARSKIDELLNIPVDMDVISVVLTGYPAEKPEQMPRRPIDEVCDIIR